MLFPTRSLLKKLPPGVLKKYREGVPRPSVMDDIAGVRLSRTETLSVSPRYVDFRAGLGPLVFHHMNYCNGARGPHRPIVLRNVFGAYRGGWRGAVNRLIVQGQYGWQAVGGPEVPELPSLTFAVGTARKSEYLVVPPSTSQTRHSNAHRPTARQQQTHASDGGISSCSDHSAPQRATEPWRLGIAIDPHLPTTQQTLVQPIPKLRDEEMLVDAESECFLLPWQSLVVDVTAPDDVVSMCRRANAHRAKQQYDAGLRTRTALENHAAEGFGLESTTSTIRVKEGDVLFLPSDFSYKMSRPTGYAVQDGLSHDVSQHGLSSVGNGVANDAPSSAQQRWRVDADPPKVPDDIACARVRYKRYPRLSDHQARVYMPADFTIGRLGAFYANGGNALIPKYT